MMMTDSDFAILLVEDNKHDVRFVKRAFKINQIENPLYIVPNGQACLDFLKNENEYSDSDTYPRPGIILMDVRMPVMDGIECLHEIKSSPDLKSIPIIMLTTSKEDADRIRSYELGCNTFIQKPVDFQKFSRAMMTLHEYWRMSELP